MFEAIGMKIVKRRGCVGQNVRWIVKTRGFVGLGARWIVKTRGSEDMGVTGSGRSRNYPVHASRTNLYLDMIY